MTRKDKRTYRVLGLIGMLLVILFAITWFAPGNIPQIFEGPLRFLNIPLFVLTSYIVWHEITAGIYSYWLVRMIQPYRYLPPQKGLKVAFITTFVPGKEPHSMLHRSLTAMKEAHYDHDTWLLDEGDDAEAKRICHELGVKYFTRRGVKKYNTEGGLFAAKTKGGNHNAWYDAYGYMYDIVAQVDTDFIVKKNFLTETLGQFRDPRVAFVGTPQYYGNLKDGLVARGAAEQTYSFYGPMLRGQSGYDSVMMIGANHIVRVAALKSVGWYAGHLTEDLLTGMRLFAAGWRSAYCPKVLAVGEGPTSWGAFFAQQMRWAHGCFDVLFRHSWRLLPKMNLTRRLSLFVSLQHYFSGFNLVVGSTLLASYFFFGISTVDYSIEKTLLIYLPLLTWLYVVPLWYHRFNILDKKEHGLMPAGKAVNLAAQPIFFLALIGALRNKKITFQVTPKGRAANDDISLRLFRFHIILGILSLAALIVGLGQGRHSYILVFWAITNTINATLFVGLVLRTKMRDSKKLHLTSLSQ